MLFESSEYKELEAELVEGLAAEQDDPDRLNEKLSRMHEDKWNSTLQLVEKIKPELVPDRREPPSPGLFGMVRKSAIRAEGEGWHPVTPLGMLFDTAGFDYSYGQDMVFSSLYNYQRLLGYCDLYDNAAIAMMTRIDCEPILFEYRDYDWRIELWKGQYGIETGCEIGIYRREKGKPLSELEEKTGPMFICVPDSWMMPMSLTLRKIRKNGSEHLFQRKKANQWWLTAFRWGVFSDPKHLEMDIAVNLRDREMTDAFCNALDELGYMPDRNGNNVEFCFGTPKTGQPESQKLLGPGVQIVNRITTSLFNLFKKKLNIKTNNPNEIWYTLKKHGIDILPRKDVIDGKLKDNSPMGFLKSWIAKRFLSGLFELLGM